MADDPGDPDVIHVSVSSDHRLADVGLQIHLIHLYESLTACLPATVDLADRSSGVTAAKADPDKT